MYIAKLVYIESLMFVAKFLYCVNCHYFRPCQTRKRWIGQHTRFFLPTRHGSNVLLSQRGNATWRYSHILRNGHISRYALCTRFARIDGCLRCSCIRIRTKGRTVWISNDIFIFGEWKGGGYDSESLPEILFEVCKVKFAKIHRNVSRYDNCYNNF